MLIFIFQILELLTYHIIWSFFSCYIKIYTNLYIHQIIKNIIDLVFSCFSFLLETWNDEYFCQYSIETSWKATVACCRNMSIIYIKVKNNWLIISFNATFKRQFLLVEETGVPRKNLTFYRKTDNPSQSKLEASAPTQAGVRTHNLSADWLVITLWTLGHWGT